MAGRERDEVDDLRAQVLHRAQDLLGPTRDRQDDPDIKLGRLTVHRSGGLVTVELIDDGGDFTDRMGRTRMAVSAQRVIINEDTGEEVSRRVGHGRDAGIDIGRRPKAGERASFLRSVLDAMDDEEFASREGANGVDPWDEDRERW
jgi:hypothetical protein